VTGEATWSSTDTAVATVSGTFFTGIKTGDFGAEASLDGISAVAPAVVGHLVFLTSDAYDGNLRASFDGETFAYGVNGADYRCNWHASQIPELSGFGFTAILAGNIASASSRIPFVTRSFNRIGQVLSDEALPYWNTYYALRNAVRYDENVVPVLAGEAWTGASSSGINVTGGNCNDWSSSLTWYTGIYGLTNSYYNGNTKEGTADGYCDQPRPLYCASNPPPGVGMSAAAGVDAGDVNVWVSFPADTTGWSSVEIRRASGATAPSTACDSGLVVETYTAPYTNVSFTDATGIVDGSSVSYRACVFGGGIVHTLSTAKRENVLPHQ
jgi:hypothetical protein